ncbi:MAG: hypothetical protein ACE5PV_09545, partial [Candidatus Poribacteria bacterium]
SFTNALISDTLTFLPQALEFENREEFRAYLIDKLPYNSIKTRERYARYLLNRFYDEDGSFLPLHLFLSLFSGKPESKEAVYLHLLEQEPLVQKVVESSLVPAVAKGEVTTQEIKNCIRTFFPKESALKKNTHALIRALTDLSKLHRQKPGYFHVSLTRPSLWAFLYVLHALFDQPGIYSVGELVEHPCISLMLWQKSSLKEKLYEAWREGFLAKVSDIDGIEQFSTKWTLQEVVHAMKKRVQTNGNR